MKGTAIRWLKFNAVGAIGILVQLATLTFLKNTVGINYLVATAMAVEVTVIHNFWWHERFTWAGLARKGSLPRFAKFNLTTGMFSILGNLLLMKWLVEFFKMQYIAANCASIAVCSIANFVVSDQAVFQPARSD